MAAWLSQRSTILSTFSASAINYSTLSGSAITLNSTMISLGTSTNSVYTRLSQGNFNSSVSTSSWVSSLTNRVSTTTVAMSANAQYQLALSQSSISTSVMFTSTLGTAWSTLSGATGLPNYSTISYTAGAISGDGRYGVLGAYGGYLYTTSTFGSSWTNTNPNIPRIYLPFENSITDSQGNSNVTTLVTPVYVPGIIGNNAINIANTTTGTIALATQYVRGTWANNLSLTSYTISFWFNQQSNSGQQYVFSAFNSVLSVQINNNGHLNATIPIAASEFYTPFNIPVFQTIMLNAWYNITLIYQSTGLCYLYLNNTLYGTVTGAGIYAAGNSGLFSLGSMDNSGNYAFNGYIDDLKIYNSAITFTPMVPQNWSSTAVSNTGQYMLATVTNGGLFMSSNFGSTWSQVTGTLLSAVWSNAQISATGQYMLVNAQPQIVQPQLTGLASNSWQVNGITWTASASISNTPTQGPFNAFSGSYPVAWVGALGAYRNGSPFNYTAGTYSTNIQGIGAIGGDWLQIQSSVPIVMYSYTWASSGFLQMPKNYYIIGSNDTLNWYPIQNVVGVTNPLNTGNTACTSYIIVNNTSTQTVQGNIAGSFTTTAYSTSSNAYIYFRLVVTNVWGYENGNVNVGQWFINFQAGGQTYSTNYGATWSNYMPLYTTIQPQLSGIPSSTTALTTAAWQTNGVTWIAKASSLQASNPGTWPVSFAFDTTANAQWNSVDGYDSSGNPTIAPIKQTTVSGSTINGEWLQLESSTPLVMNSYKIGSGGSWQYPKSYTIAGSNDNGSTWFTIQTVVLASNPSGASNQLIPSTLIVVAQSGIQTVITSAATANATCIPGANSTTAFTYFRIIAQSIFGNGGNACLSIGEWVINFVGGTLSTQALSESGQYQLTANATVSPILLGQLNFENSYTDTAPTPTLTYVGNQGYNSGSNISLSNVQAKVGSNSLYSANIAGATTNLSYANYTLSSFFNGATAYTISTWLYPAALPASSAAVPYHLTNSTFVVAAYPYINTNGTIGLAFYTTTSGTVAFGITTTTIISINTWTHLVIMFASGIASIYINGILSATGVYTGTICLANNGGASTNLIVGAATNAYGGYNGFIDDVRIYNAGLTSTQIYTLYATTTLTPAIYITQNFNMNTLVLPTFTPALNAVTNVPVASAISNTGQYMVVITNNTSGNNVYYSMNYGATFTGLQLGTAQLTSCAMSYDGSYITIVSGETVYTLNNNSTGFSVALGNQAGYQNQANNAIAIGNYAGYQNQTANSIILNASGPGALGTGLNAVTQGFYVAPIASYTASSSQVFTLLGYGSDSQITQGIGSISTTLGNVYIGQNVGILNTTGYQNVIIGQAAGGSITTGYNTTLIGNYAGPVLTTSYNNTFIGTAAGRDTTTGSLNTFLGVLAGAGNITGGNNICIGTAAYCSSVSSVNEIVIGTNITGSGSNTVKIGCGTNVVGTTITFFNNVTYTSMPTYSNVTLQASNATYNMGYISFLKSDLGGAYMNIGLANTNNVQQAYLMLLPTNATASILQPAEDNVMSLGGSSRRFVSVFAVNGAIQTSDSNEKNLTILPYGLNELLQMKTIMYKWKSQDSLPDTDPTKHYQYYGLCADQLAAILPELVYDDDPTTPIQMNYSEIIPICVKAIQEQHAEITTLKQQIVNMASQLAALTQRLVNAGIA